MGLKRLCLLAGGLSSTRVYLSRDCHFFSRVRRGSTMCCVRARVVRLTLRGKGVTLTRGVVRHATPIKRLSTGVLAVHGRCLRRCFRHTNSCHHTCRCLGHSYHLSSSVHDRQMRAHITRLSVHCHRSAVMLQGRVRVRQRTNRIGTLGLDICV